MVDLYPSLLLAEGLLGMSLQYPLLLRKDTEEFGRIDVLTCAETLEESWAASGTAGSRGRAASFALES